VDDKKITPIEVGKTKNWRYGMNLKPFAFWTKGFLKYFVASLPTTQIIEARSMTQIKSTDELYIRI
jgi:hypothetical protein